MCTVSRCPRCADNISLQNTYHQNQGLRIEEREVWIHRILQKDPQANPRDMGPTCKQVVALISEHLETSQVNIFP